MAKTAYLYTRVSTDAQGELGLDAQRKVGQDLYRDHVQKEYPTLVTLVEEGVSARTHDFERRPKGKELHKLAGKGDCIIFPKIDRGFRNLRDLLNCLHFWDRIGVRIFSTDFGLGGIYDSKSIQAKIGLIFLGLAAEIEGHRASQRMTDFAANQRKMGRAASGYAAYGFKYVRRGAPIGTKNQPPAWVQPADNEQTIGRWVQKTRSQGIGSRTIQKHMNANGITNRKGAQFGKEEICLIGRLFTKIIAWEEMLQKERGFPLREHEFVSDHGVLCVRFDRPKGDESGK